MNNSIDWSPMVDLSSVPWIVFGGLLLAALALAALAWAMCKLVDRFSRRSERP